MRICSLTRTGALATGKIYYRIRKRKRWCEFLGLLKALRARWTGEKLYVVLDNFSPHKHPDVRVWAAAHDIELVFLPTYGSWLNWIESELAALRYFALNGTDHRGHSEQNAVIAAYIRRHNAKAALLLLVCPGLFPWFPDPGRVVGDAVRYSSYWMP
ncbi:transposase [Streptomyces triculaminicus]|uniref:transposase n=1 Tax=Streptomyces triculaminicus TaxID=2816232 RepID=UPI0037D47B9E